MRWEHFSDVPPFVPFTNACFVPGIVLGAGDTVGGVTGGDPCFQELKFRTPSSALPSPEHMPGMALSAEGRAHNGPSHRGAEGEPKAQRG